MCIYDVSKLFSLYFPFSLAPILSPSCLRSVRVVTFEHKMQIFTIKLIRFLNDFLSFFVFAIGVCILRIYNFPLHIKCVFQSTNYFFSFETIAQWFEYFVILFVCVWFLWNNFRFALIVLVIRCSTSLKVVIVVVIVVFLWMSSSS